MTNIHNTSHRRRIPSTQAACMEHTLQRQRQRLAGIWITTALVAVYLLATATAQGQTGEDTITADVVLQQHPAPDQPLIVEFKLSIPDGYHVYSSRDHFFDIRETSSENLGPMQIDKPPTKEIPDILQDTPGATAEVFDGDATITVTRIAAAESGAPWLFEGSLRFQGCSETLCFPPETVRFAFDGVVGETDQATAQADGEAHDAAGGADNAVIQSGQKWQTQVENFDIVTSKAGYVRADEFHTFLERAKSGTAAAPQSPFEALEGASVWVAVLLILIGGFLLNLTPCVLPMIPINLAIIGAGAAAGSRRRGFFLGGLYGLSIALVYGVLGLIVVFTGSTFGAFSASPVFNFAIAGLFAVLGLAALGAFNIDFSRLGTGLNTPKWQKGSYALAIFMGGVSALLAGACVAPVVIAVLLLSAQHYADGNVLGLLYPFLLGLGMGLPWPFAGGGITFLPKPGAWMKYVRYVFGIFVFLLAAYYAYLGVGLLSYDEGDRPAAVAKAQDGLTWHTALEPALTEAQDTGKKVFIDFWATWCKNCKTMEHTTFRDERVRASLKDFALVKYQAEDPDAPQTKEVLDYFGVRGLPTYVILEPK